MLNLDSKSFVSVDKTSQGCTHRHCMMTRPVPSSCFFVFWSCWYLSSRDSMTSGVGSCVSSPGQPVTWYCLTVTVDCCHWGHKVEIQHRHKHIVTDYYSTRDTNTFHIYRYSKSYHAYIIQIAQKLKLYILGEHTDRANFTGIY